MKLAKTNDFCGARAPKLTAVMIHGIASDSHSFDHAIKYFKEQPELAEVRFVTFDLLGSGKSYKGDDLDYGYSDQLSALNESIADLKLKTLLVLVGHSLGTFIVTRYAKKYPGDVQNLILVSPPIYAPEDFANPLFIAGIEMFEKFLEAGQRGILQTKVFRNSMDKIVLDEKNYETLAKTKVPTTLIYGDEDQIIAAHNIPRMLNDNSKIEAIKTHGRHGATRDKYTEIKKVLEKILHA